MALEPGTNGTTSHLVVSFCTLRKEKQVQEEGVEKDEREALPRVKLHFGITLCPLVRLEETESPASDVALFEA